jgi:AcrR family transcriptional regulator
MSARERPDGRTERAHQQRAERRATVLEAALRVFAARGYHGTSISDLVEEAGVARGTFYLYFESKNAVFLALLETLFDTFVARLHGVDTSQGAPDLRAQVVQIVSDLLHTARNNRAVAAILFREAPTLEAEVTERVQGFYDRLHGWLAASLANGVRLGLLRPHDPDIVATATFGSLRAALERYAVADVPGGADLDHVARELVDHGLSGLLTPGAPP